MPEPIIPRIIGIDFDGTCCTHEFPAIGKSIGAVDVLEDLIKAGHRLILWTMRSDREGKPYLSEARQWLQEQGVEVWGVNSNPEQHWSDSPKAYCHLYLDDAALGAPLAFDPALSERPFYDWRAARLMLQHSGYLPSTKQDIPPSHG